MMQPEDSRLDDVQRGAGASAAAQQRSGMSPAVIVFGVLAAVGLIFFLGNGSQTEFHFLVWEWTTTVRWMILLSILLGVVLDRTFSFWRRRRRKRKARLKGED